MYNLYLEVIPNKPSFINTHESKVFLLALVKETVNRTTNFDNYILEMINTTSSFAIYDADIAVRYIISFNEEMPGSITYYKEFTIKHISSFDQC